jgi:hypothetical protein
MQGQYSMVDTNRIALGLVIILVFIWRFARTRQLYVTSLQVHARGSEPVPFNPHDLHSFVQQVLLGRRSIKPTSFFIRAVVLAAVAVCLLPFKDYEPLLLWLVIVLIALYVPWCILHGVMLKKRVQI